MRNVSFYGLLMVVLLLPWYIVRWSLMGIPITLLEVAIGITACFWLIEYRPWRQWSLYKQWIVEHRWLVIWIGLIVIAAGISVYISSNHRQALGELKAYIVEPLIILVILVTTIRSDKKRWWLLISALALAGLEVGLVGSSQIVLGWPNIAPAELAQGRASSFFNTANAVGLFVGPIIAVIAGVVLSRLGTHRQQLSLIVSLVTMVAVLLLSQSMGAVIGGAAVLLGFALVFAIKRLNAGKGVSPGLGGGLSIALIVAYMALSLGFVWFINNPPVVANPYSRPNFSTFTVRQCVWQGTKAMLQQQPLFGAGLAGFSQAYLHHTTCDAEPLVYPHMLALNFWTELGLLGLLGYIGIMAWWLRESWPISFLAKPESWIMAGLCLALVYWLVHGLVDVPYFKNDLAVEWWVLFGLVLTSRRVYNL